MTVADFIAKWRHHELKERSAAQEHFIDLCRLVGHPTPAQADPEGRWFTFERGAAKATGGEGWADVSNDVVPFIDPSHEYVAEVKGPNPVVDFLEADRMLLQSVRDE